MSDNINMRELIDNHRKALKIAVDTLVDISNSDSSHVAQNRAKATIIEIDRILKNK